MTDVDISKRPEELGEVLALYEELYLIYRSFDSLYEIVEHQLVGKEALLMAPLVCIIRDRLARAGVRYEDTFSIPHGDQMFTID
ncbi:hypothetical protein [Thalassolituus oleivorans]|nr:hypothetical protein [Thalassolituus oleivorans]PHQ83465.1 MAG: hypothetical protein COB58_13690 [Thalassobium sp.]